LHSHLGYYQLLLSFHVWPANQPVKSSVAVSQKIVGGAWYQAFSQDAQPASTSMFSVTVL